MIIAGIFMHKSREGGEAKKEEAKITMRPKGSCADEKKETIKEKPGAVKALSFDLHIHSNHSCDSDSGVEDIILEAKRKDLDGIALTDHSCVDGNDEAVRLGEKHGIIVIPGNEARSVSGDILILGTKELVPSGLSTRDTIDFAHKLGAIAVAAHPFSRVPARYCVGNEIVGEGFDAVETHNARTLVGNKNADLVARQNGKVCVAGSDAHTLEEVGNARTIIVSSPDVPSILRAIRNGKVSIVTGSLSVKQAARWCISKAGRTIRSVGEDVEQAKIKGREFILKKVKRGN